MCESESESEEAAKCSPEQVSNKPLEVCDDDDGGGIDDQGKHANACSMDMPLQHYTTEFVESDFDFKVLISCVTTLFLYLGRKKIIWIIFLVTVDLVLFQSQSLDTHSDDDDTSQISSSSNSSLNPSQVEGIFFPRALRLSK